MTTTVQDQVGQVTDTVSAQARDLAGEVSAQARQVTRQARTELESQADQQIRRLGSGMADTAGQLREMADAGRAGPVSQVVREIGDLCERVSGRIEDRGARGVADELRALARRRPGAFLVGAGIAGFATARLLRGAVAGANGATGPTPAQPAAGRGSGGFGAQPDRVGSGVVAGAPAPDVPVASGAVPPLPLDVP